MQKEKQQQKNTNKIKLPPLAFLVCLILSSIAWFFYNFSKDQEQTMTYRLVCSDLPEGNKVCTLSDTTLLLTFNTKGLNYLTPKFAEENRIVNISVKELIRYKPKRSAYTFSDKELRDFLQEQGYSDLKSVDKPEVITLYIR